jgi:hypothetical protein
MGVSWGRDDRWGSHADGLLRVREAVVRDGAICQRDGRCAPAIARGDGAISNRSTAAEADRRRCTLGMPDAKEP